MTGSAPESARRGHVLIARLDSLGDLLLAGPAVRAAACSAARVTMLVGEGRREDASLLPGVDEVIEFAAPWVVFEPGAVQPDKISALITEDSRRRGRRRADLDIFSPIAPATGAAAPDGRRRLDRCDQRGLPRLAARSAPSNPPAAPRARTKPLPGAGRRFPARRDGASPSCARPLPEVAPWTGSDPYLVFHPGASTQFPPAQRQNTAECWWPAWWTPAIG